MLLAEISGNFALIILGAIIVLAWAMDSGGGLDD